MTEIKRRIARLCYTDIKEYGELNHSAFTEGHDGKLYFDIAIVDKKPDEKTGKDVGVLMNPSKENRENKSEMNCWIGGGWRIKPKEQSGVDKSKL